MTSDLPPETVDRAIRAAMEAELCERRRYAMPATQYSHEDDFIFCDMHACDWDADRDMCSVVMAVVAAAAPALWGES